MNNPNKRDLAFIFISSNFPIAKICALIGYDSRYIEKLIENRESDQSSEVKLDEFVHKVCHAFNSEYIFVRELIAAVPMNNRSRYADIIGDHLTIRDLMAIMLRFDI